MAAIVISSNNGLKTNQTTPFIPYNNNGVFENSILEMREENILGTTRAPGDDGTVTGLFIDNENGLYQFGDFGNEFNGCNIILDSEYGNITFSTPANFNINLNGTGRIYIDGTACIAATAGLTSNRYLSLSINGTDYKILLLNNSL